MRYLLDTNIFLYVIDEDFSSLSKRQYDVVFGKDNELYLSEASIFEIAIKCRLDKDSFKHVNVESLEKHRKRLGIKLLASKETYYLNIINVPKVVISGQKVHSDPFDLLIISQALTEKMPILSTDKLFPKYEGLKVVN